MKQLFKLFGAILLFAAASQAASLGTISGTVKGPDGAPFKGAFVRAQNQKTRITTIVLSDGRGQYRIQDLPVGEYQVRATAVSFKSDPQPGIKVDAGQPASVDFALQKGTVRWSDLSIHQTQVLLPEDAGKNVLFTRCMSCHGVQTKIAGTRRDEDGWRACVALMRDLTNGVGDPRITDEDREKLAPYLSKVFGLEGDFARSPSQLPAYEQVKHAAFTDETLKIVYVDYDLPGPNRIPWDANPTPHKNENVWLAFGWTANKIANLNPETGMVQEWNTPPPVFQRHAMHVHSVIQAPDGTVWFVEDTQCRLSKFDPETQKMSTYQPPSCKSGATAAGVAGLSLQGGGSVRMDRLGNIWVNGGNLWRFEPKTEKFTEFPEGGHAYSLELDPKEGNVWFAQLEAGKIGMVDIKTLKLTRWTPPASAKLAELNKNYPDEIGNTLAHPKSAGPRRITPDSQGIVWFGEWWAGQIGRFDPKTQTFQEFPLPDPDPTPYGIGVDRAGYVWYSSYDDDILGRLDPKTGAVVEFPFPYSGNGIRELLPDDQGRMWFGTPFNNKVGYFIPPDAPLKQMAQTSAKQ